MNRARVPWYLWCSALAVTSAYVGGYWDISWHRSIGRGSFWGPPPMASYARGGGARVVRRLLVAPAVPPRLVLGPAAHGDLRLRRARGTVVGLSHFHDDVQRARA